MSPRALESLPVRAAILLSTFSVGCDSETANTTSQFAYASIDSVAAEVSSRASDAGADRYVPSEDVAVTGVDADMADSVLPSGDATETGVDVKVIDGALVPDDVTVIEMDADVADSVLSSEDATETGVDVKVIDGALVAEDISVTEVNDIEIAGVDADVNNEKDSVVDIDLGADATANVNICAKTIADQCLQQYQKIVCADSCALTDEQVEAEMQSKVDKLIGDFDKVVTSLGQPPKSSIYVGKKYEIVDGKVNWSVNIKNAMDPLHIEYELGREEDGEFQELTWLVTESTLIPEKFNTRTIKTTPCKTVKSQTMDVTSSNNPSVNVVDELKADLGNEADLECKYLELNPMPYWKTIDKCSTFEVAVFDSNQCSVITVPSSGKKSDFFAKKWSSEGYANMAEYKAFIAKLFAQFQAMLKKHGMDVT